MKDKILELKKSLNAVILAHSYQNKDIQDVADFVGDSLGLSQQAAKTKADVIVFCGVRFMAETAKILNPTKTVILPDINAGCTLEESCSAKTLKEFKDSFPNYYVVAYINCSAEVKALSDIICTSGNALKMVEQAPIDRPVLFVPDENLGEWVKEQTKRHITLWNGNCYAHVEFKTDAILSLAQKYPHSKIIAHPECTKAVRGLADEICSTEGMVKYCKNVHNTEFIVITEEGMLHRLRKECPTKLFHCVPSYNVMKMPTDNCRCQECKYMKMNTLEKVYNCMLNLNPKIELSEDILEKARIPLERMLSLS